MKEHCPRNYRSLLAATLAWALTTPVWAAQPPRLTRSRKRSRLC